MVLARSVPQGANYHMDVVTLLPYFGMKMEAMSLRPTLAQFLADILYTPLDNMPLHSAASL